MSHNDHAIVNDSNVTGIPPIYSAPDPDLINNNIWGKNGIKLQKSLMQNIPTCKHLLYTII
jgi:hypothetical protein